MLAVTQVTIAELLSDIARRRSVSERQLAAYMGVSPTAMNRWVNGQGIPDPVYCWKIAELAGLAVEEVMRIAGHLPPAAEGEPPDPPWLAQLIAELREMRLTPAEADVLDATVQGLRALRAERGQPGAPGQPSQEASGS